MSNTKNKNNAKDKACAAAILDMHDDPDYIRKVQDRTARMSLEGYGRASTDPDDPACDACGKEFGGIMQCSVCHAAFYCSSECQRGAWKKGGHKLECSTMQAECEKTGNAVVATMTDSSVPKYMVVDDGAFERLDGQGAYRAAVKAGLHEAILELLRYDKENVTANYRNGMLSCLTQHIMSVLFRGQRVEGKSGAKNPNFGCVDASRIKAFIRSDPDAFDVWMDASIEVYRLPLERDIYADPELHKIAHRTARDVWAAWIMVFTRKQAVKAILLGPSKEPDADAVDRAKALAKKFKVLLTHRKNAGDDRDPNSTLEGVLNQIVAMIEYWLDEFGVKVDFVKPIKVHKQLYNMCAKPLAIGTIKKGKTLSNEEARAAMAQAARHVRR